MGSTPASEAAENGHTEVIRALHEAGTDLNRSDNHGRTPAYFAARSGCTEVIRALREAGVRIPILPRLLFIILGLP